MSVQTQREHLRSRKYRTLDDEKILALFASSPNGEQRHFLQLELEVRGLQDRVEEAVAKERKKKPTSPWKIVLTIFIAAMAMARIWRSL